MADDDFQLQFQLQQQQSGQVSQVKTKTDEDGTVYEWDEDKKAWFPKIDDNFIAQYQMSYGSSSANTVSEVSAHTTHKVTPEELNEWFTCYWSQHKSTVCEFEDKEDEEAHRAHRAHYFNYYYTNYPVNHQLDPPTRYKQFHDWYEYYYGQHNSNTSAATDQQSYTDNHQAVIGENEQSKSQAASSKKKQKPSDGKKTEKSKNEQSEKKWFEITDEDNKSVYVSGLPDDITDEEFKELMSKYGLIMYDPFTQKPKLKLYRKKDNSIKGDGICTYIKQESVDLALRFLDGDSLRGNQIRVEKAKFELKGTFDPSKKKRKLTNKEKRKIQTKVQKLFDWRPDKPLGTRGKHEKVVILKNLFDPKDFEADPLLIGELKNDLQTTAAKYGDVKKVVVYDRHEDGVASLSYREPEQADAAVEALRGRTFGACARRITAATWDGKTRYDVKETEKQRAERMSKWESYLQQQPVDGASAVSSAPGESSATTKSSATTESSATSESSSTTVSSATTESSASTTSSANTESSANNESSATDELSATTKSSATT